MLRSQPAKQICLKLEEVEEADSRFSGGLGIMKAAVSGQRVVDYDLMEREVCYELSDEDLEALLRIVEAEAGSEDEDGRQISLDGERGGVPAEPRRVTVFSRGQRQVQQSRRQRRDGSGGGQGAGGGGYLSGSSLLCFQKARGRQ